MNPTLRRALVLEREPLPSLTRKGWYPWLVVATVCVGAFIGQLDASIMSLVLPALEEAFHRPLSQVQWVALAYLLVLIGFLIPLGRLADNFGRKALYTLGFLVFIAGSALCGFAPGLPVLIGARVLQGVGAAMLQANSVAIITATVPETTLGRAIGVQGVAQALGLAVGPAVGGFLIGWLDWRWVFFINVPVGILGSALAWVALPRTSGGGRGERVSGWGTLLLFTGLAVLLLALSFLHAAGYLLPVSAALLLGFWALERWGAAPLLKPAVLRAPGLLAGLTAALLSYAVLFGGLLAVPLLLERVFGATPGQAGLVLTVVPVTLALVAEGGGLLSDRYGTRLPTVTGMGFAVGGLMLMEGIRSASDPRLFAGLALLGVGMGLFIPANNAGVMRAAPTASLGLTGGLINMMRGLGASLGIALVSAVLMVRVGRGPTHVASSAGVGSGVGIALAGLAAAALLGLFLSLRGRRPAS